MQKIDQIERVSITEKSIEKIKEYIMQGKLKNGDFLPPEQELCKQLGIGRSTLREAIKILEIQGFVQKRHGVGMMIVNESNQAALDMLQLMLKRNGHTMSELIEVRYAIELRTTELAAQNANKEDIEEIRKTVQVMKNNITTKKEYKKADIDFHMAIAKASHNNIFQFILQTIRPLIEDMIEKTLVLEPRPEQSMKYHEKIFKAIENKNPDLALASIKEHLDATKTMLN